MEVAAGWLAPQGPPQDGRGTPGGRLSSAGAGAGVRSGAVGGSAALSRYVSTQASKEPSYQLSKGCEEILTLANAVGRGPTGFRNASTTSFLTVTSMHD